MANTDWLFIDDVPESLRETLVAQHRADRLKLHGCKLGSDRERLIDAAVYRQYPDATLLRGNFFGVPASRQRPINLLFARVWCWRKDIDKPAAQRPRQPRPLNAELLQKIAAFTANHPERGQSWLHRTCMRRGAIPLHVSCLGSWRD